MRITGGEFGARRLKVPRSDAVRPTQDSVREALFSMLGAAVAGADFLDLFAGSGAVGLEALSRGAKSATFVELNRRHIAVVRENAAALAVGERARFVAADCARYLGAYSGDGFDIVFSDPPYALAEETGFASALAAAAERGVVRPGGLFVGEMSAAQRLEDMLGWELVRDRTYGRTRLVIWRRFPRP